MGDKESTLYYVLPEGATQEETCSWSEIHALCEAGQLSPNSLIYMPEKNAWEKAVDTDLRSCFESLSDSLPGKTEEVQDDETRTEELQEKYESACREIRRTPEIPKAHLNAASAALALGNREAAIGHFQQAIELQPFNAKIACEIKRNLSVEERKRVRLLERPTPFWENNERVITYPFGRGYLYFLAPAVALSLLALLPFVRPAVVVLCYLWGYRAVSESASGSLTPPHWRDYLSSPAAWILRALLVGLFFAVEFCLPFFLIAQISILAGASSRPDVFQFIQHSPVMIVCMWVIGVIYFPAVLVISVSPGSGIKDMLNVKKSVKAVVSMELEYIATIVFLFALLLVWVGVRLILGSVPVVGVVFSVLLGAYGVLCTGFVLGRVSTRCRHLWMGAPTTSAPAVEETEALSDAQ